MDEQGPPADQIRSRSSHNAFLLTDAREQAHLSLEDAAEASAVPHLAELESGRRRPTPRDLDLLSATYGVDLSDLLHPRREVVLDRGTGDLVVSGVKQRVRDVDDPDSVYEAYLFLLYAVRGAQRGQEIPLRAADLDALLGVVGGEPERIEKRLVELMGCSREEAPLLRRVLLRHRAATAVAGAAVGLSLVSFVAAYAADTPPPVPAGHLGGAASAPQEIPQTGVLSADEPCLAEATSDVDAQDESRHDSATS